MRITNSMMTGQVIYNMQNSIRRFTEMQTQASSGRRINKPSDDPLGTLRDLNYRTQLAKIDQFHRNVAQGTSWYLTYNDVLFDVNNFINGAKDLALNMANSDKDASIRENAARDIQSKLDQMISLANKEIGGSRIFGGFKTKVDPFVQSGNGVVYNGDAGEIKFEVDTGQLMTININGSDTFFRQLGTLGEKADLNVALTSGTLLADLHLTAGVDLSTFTITDRNNDALPVSTVDITGLATVGEVITAINNQLTADGLTNVTARIGDEGNNIILESTEDGLISGSALLSKMNAGAGIDLTDGRIRVTDGAAMNVVVDLTGATTLDDVITKFNTQLNTALAAAGHAPVNMAVNATNTGLTITDTNGVPLGLSIEDMPGSSSTALDLGILGGVSPVLNGTDLNPVTHFEIGEGAGTTGADLGLLGDFSGTHKGLDIDPALTANMTMASLNNGLGMVAGEIAIYQGAASHIVDVADPTFATVQDFLDDINNSGLDVTASINSAGTGIQIVNNDANRSFVIGEANLDHAAKGFGLFGSSDVFGSFIALRNALQKDDRKGSELLVEHTENAMQHVLNQLALVGGRGDRLIGTKSRLDQAAVNYTLQLSEVEDADFTQLVTSLATFENNYQAALLSAAKIIQPTLLNFLRV